MSILDKVVAALTPPESDEDRANARARAEAYAPRAPWSAMVLDHHRQIDDAFAAVSNGVQKGPPIGVEEGPPFQII
ncbi:hypothetical protein [Sphingobium xenophagum]